MVESHKENQKMQGLKLVVSEWNPNDDMGTITSMGGSLGEILSYRDPIQRSLTVPGDPGLLAAIGRVAAAAANLDELLVLMQIKMDGGMNDNAKAYDEYIKDGGGRGVENIKRKIKCNKYNNYDKIIDILGEGTTTEPMPNDEKKETVVYLLFRRNKLMHHGWYVDENRKTVRAHAEPGKPLAWGEYPTVDKLNELADKIIKVTTEMDRLRTR